MNVTIEQAVLLRELGLLQGVVERKATIPMLANVLITAVEDGRVVVMATDLEVSFKATFHAQVDAPGTVAVDARRLHDITRRLPPGNIGFRLQKDSLHVSLEKIRYRLATQETETFPTLPRREGEPSGAIESRWLADMIRRVIFAVTTDDPRYSLGGALWKIETDRLTMVATDGHRLALSSRPGRRLESEMGDIVVPRKALAEIGKLAAEDEGETRFWARGGTLFVEVGSRELSTHLLEMKFPDYTRVVPKSNDKKLEVGTADLRAAIERVAVLSQDQSRMVKLDLAESRLVLSSEHHAHGEAVEELSVVYGGKPLQIGFNAQYLVDFLATCGTETVRLELGEVMGQGLLHPTRPDDDERQDRYVVMPMALS